MAERAEDDESRTDLAGHACGERRIVEAGIRERHCPEHALGIDDVHAALRELIRQGACRERAVVARPGLDVIDALEDAFRRQRAAGTKREHGDGGLLRRDDGNGPFLVEGRTAAKQGDQGEHTPAGPHVAPF